ncbi:MAG: hypothetical protein WDO18_13350 [Acidobacteriota bacterium]
MKLGSHEAQMILTTTLVVATALMALFCDFLRAQRSRTRQTVAKAAPPLETSIAHTLVPDLPHAPARAIRASRLTASLEQGRRDMSPAARAIIEEVANAAKSEMQTARKSAASQTAKAVARRAS